MSQIYITGDYHFHSFLQTVCDGILFHIFQPCMHIIPHSLTVFQRKYHLLARTQNNSRFRNHQLLSYRTLHTDSDIHPVKKFIASIHPRLYTHHTIFIHQRIDFTDISLTYTGSGSIRSHFHFIPYLNQRQLTFKHSEINFHRTGVNYPAKSF